MNRRLNTVSLVLAAATLGVNLDSVWLRDAIPPEPRSLKRQVGTPGAPGSKAKKRRGPGGQGGKRR